ncbi:hypothetical protein CPT32_14370 [Rhizobium sophoriradicis]|nr:hypothetical protein CPT32_14370 [Rhizobium sophoriradicis]
MLHAGWPAIGQGRRLSALIPVLVTGIQPRRVCAVNDSHTGKKSLAPNDLGALDPCDEPRDEGDRVSVRAKFIPLGRLSRPSAPAGNTTARRLAGLFPVSRIAQSNAADMQAGVPEVFQRPQAIDCP